jgi:uncharacterized paraquat-inducible protein A
VPDVTCAQCDHEFAAPVTSRGQKVHCPQCRAWVVVPATPPTVRVFDPATRAMWRTLVIVGCMALAAVVIFKIIEEIDRHKAVMLGP